MDQVQRLRQLAAWYRKFAERAGEPAIWEGRLRTADKLEREAVQLEKQRAKHTKTKPMVIPVGNEVAPVRKS